MKCRCCRALICDTDDFCISCGATLGRVRRAVAAERIKAATPPWAYVLAALCGGIPVAAFGGAYPAVLGLGGACLVITVARIENVPNWLRFLVCLGITAVAWLVFITIIVEMMPSVRKRFYSLIG